MIYPKFLSNGDCVGVPAPSGGAYDELHSRKYENAKLNLEKRGYKVTVSKNINNSVMARSASAGVRADEINEMFGSKDIDFVMCAAGGEFLVEILPFVEFDRLVKNPKFVQGFSDPTGLLFPITTKYDIATIYGNNFGDYGVLEENFDRSILDNLEIIKGNIILQENYNFFEGERAEKLTGLEGYNFTTPVEWKCLNESEVCVEGRIIGGCLDIIAEIAGTKYDGMKEFNERYKEDGVILYFDNCELSKEELIRTLWKLNEFEYFKYAKAIVFGRNGIEISGLGYTMEQALEDSVIYGLNVPIMFDTDISHKGPCLTIINGAVATVSYSEGKGNIGFELR